MTARIHAALRREVRERADGRCEYCLLAEEDAFFPHEPDHIVAEKHGGATDAANLALSCLECNRFKGSDIASIDPATGALVALFHPRQEAWSTHFRGTNDGTIVALTPTGRVTVALLRLNAPARVEVRHALAEVRRWP